jgi:AsmA protein
MKKTIRWIGIILAVLVVAVVALLFLINPNTFRPRLESSLSEALGRDVKLGDLKLSILSGGVTAQDLSIADDPVYSRSPFVQAKALNIGVELWPLIVSRKLNVTGLTIDHPQVQLIQSPDGAWNFASLGGKAAAKPRTRPASAGQRMDLSVKLVKITAGRFFLGRTGGHSKPLVLDPVDLELRDFAADSSFPFTFSAKVVGGGAINLDGKAGPIPADVSTVPMSATLKVSQFDLAGSGWTQAIPGMGGIIAFDGSGESDGKEARIKGKLKAEKLKLARNATAAARVIELDFGAEHNLKTRAGRLSQGDIHIGSAVARLTGTYTPQGESTLLKMNLAGPSMPIQELAAMLPAMGIALPNGSSFEGGTAAVNLAMEGLVEKLVTSGSLAFRNTKLTGFDLPKKMASIEKLAGIKGGPDTDIETLAAEVRMAPEGMSAQNIQVVVPAIGNLEGDGTVSPRNELGFKMRATVHTSGIAAIISNTPIPFIVEGTASEPVFRPDMKAVVVEKVKSIEGTAGKAAGSLLRDLLGGKKN